MSHLRLPLFILILVAYLAIGTLYASLTPAWQAPDEPAHYNYVRYLATKPGFPELVMGCYDQPYLEQLKSRRFPPELPIDNLCYEFHQPPLYYLLARPIFILSNGSLVALRLLSVVLGGGVVALAFFIGQTIFPNRLVIAWGTMAFVAFVPMHLAILASVNNDALAELILAVLLLLLSRRLLTTDPPSLWGDVRLGALLGIGLVTKMTVYVALPLVAVTLWLAFRGSRQPGETGYWARRLIKQAGLIYGLAFVIALPWYIRNAVLYGNFDILGLARHDQVVVGQLRTADFMTEVGGAAYLGQFVTTTFHSFWGQFGWMAVPMDGRTYLFLTWLTLLALGGLIGFGQGVLSAQVASPDYDLSTGQRRALTLMALTIILMGLAYGWYNLTFVQFQGRYLFPALIPLGLFFSLGLSEAFARRWVWWLVGGLVVALAWVALSYLLKDNLDKWAILLTGLAIGLVIGRALLARYWFVPVSWFMAACYGGLSLLALATPFWFVLPYLSP